MVLKLTSSSIVHDNGCGYGAVTLAVMHLNTEAQVVAMDINPMFMAQLRANLSERPEWPVKVETMDACNLKFPDSNFDLSLSTFVFSGLEDDVGAARYILRTLKAGGSSVIAVWKEMQWHVALENAHHQTRGLDEPIAPF